MMPATIEALARRHAGHGFKARRVPTDRGEVWRVEWTEVRQGRETLGRHTTVLWYAWGADGYHWGSYSTMRDALQAAGSPS